MKILDSSHTEMLERQASFLAWRKEYEATFDESDYGNFENPWNGLRLKDDGREFNWED